MGLNNLENKIRENRSYFDEDPSSNHIKNFEAKLSQAAKPAKKSKGFLFASNRSFAAAASVTILLLITVFALLESPTAEAKPQLSEELMHVKMYYSTQTDIKIEEIKICAASVSNDMLFETTQNRLEKLDNNTQIIEQKLEMAQGNKQLENAYIQSLKAKSEVVDQMYTQMCENNTKIISQ